ncbi:transmembrane protein 62-like [Paramacrobiotus metropolitanus]|uniref:transmembrane protein 62-like n=1 Tax=Paramacrobiotus metropolitanus TaxID=2943436 RepID=UPI0024461900|nr:transmembrane protein 62-like [Paramacrobiotus metropolitanus]
MGFPLKALLILAAPIIVVSWAVMIAINTITVSYAVLPVFRHFDDPDVLAERRAHFANVAPRDTLDNLMWFMQITDLHINEYEEPERIAQLQEFCSVVVDAVRPSVVLASGDLTDAKRRTSFSSGQNEQEWRDYARVLRESRVTEKTVWLDIRGNHDTFNVPSHDSKMNYFRTHASRGNFTSYHYVHRYGANSVSFIAMDATPDPGFRRPFNFFGIITEQQMEELHRFADDAKSSNVTIWFGHYPTSYISSPPPGISHTMRGAVAYLSGHLHTLGGLAPELYALQKSGTLELELGDWKANRLFRIAAIDHDLMSFADYEFNQWPIVLVTNPKNVRFYAPVHEPLDRIARSTHIRVLAFSPHGIHSVQILLPDATTYQTATRVRSSSPLFTLPWDASRYAIGSHTLTVRVEDSAGNIREIVQEFATRDAQVPGFSLLRRLILMGDVGRFFETLCFGMVLGNCVMLWLLGTAAWRWVAQWARGWTEWRLVREISCVVRLEWLFWVLNWCSVYPVMLPWFFGEIVEGEYGVAFSFGIWMRRQWLQGQMTYMFAVTHLLLHILPLTCCSILYARARLRQGGRWRWTHGFYHAWFAGILLLELLNLKIIGDSYGAISVPTNGLLLWSGVVPTVFLWYKCWRLGTDSRSETRKKSPLSKNDE